MAGTSTEILLNVVNNTPIPQTAVLFGGNNDVATSTNTQLYKWDVTSFVFVNQQTVEIQQKLAGQSSFTISSAILSTLTFQGVCDALNTLNLGTFFTVTTGGVTYIEVYSLTYVFGGLELYNTTNIFSITFDNISNVPVASATSVSDWNTFFNTNVNATVPFSRVTVVGNIVNLIGAAGLNVSANLFNNNQHIISINDNATISTIGVQSFNNCNNLASVSLALATSTSTSSFSSCDALSSLSLPKIITIGASSFLGCFSLTNISLPKCITIGIQSFQTCTNLTTFIAPLCINILDQAFDGCFLLTTINTPICTNIGILSFESCTALLTASFPLVTSVGDSCFSLCTALTTIYLPVCTALGSTTWDNGVFNLIIGNVITLTVPLATSTDGDVVYLQTNNTVTLITT
jgi:hypothetical protein